MKWLKLYTEILDDPKIRLLAFEDRWHYVALLCCKAEGIQDERDGIWERLLRVKLGLAEVEFDSLKKRLLEVCLIDEAWNPTGWDKRQAAQDARGAERQKRYREKLAKRNVTHNVTATSQVEDRSKKIEVEKEKNKTPMSLSAKADPVPIREIVDLYHQRLPQLPKCQKLTKTREGYIKQRWREDMPAMQNWENFFDYVANSEFLTGRAQPRNGDRPFIADLEWITRAGNFAKILEGKYHGV